MYVYDIWLIRCLVHGVAFLHGLVAFRETQGGPLEEMDDLFNSTYFPWQYQPRAVKFDYLVSRFESHPSVAGNGGRDAAHIAAFNAINSALFNAAINADYNAANNDAGPEPGIELASLGGNTVTNGASV